MCNPRLRPQIGHSLLESFWPVTWQRFLLWEVDWSEIYHNITVYNVNICKLYWNVLGVGKWHIVASIGILRSLTGHHDLDVFDCFPAKKLLPSSVIVFCTCQKIVPIPRLRQVQELKKHQDHSAAGTCWRWGLQRQKINVLESQDKSRWVKHWLNMLNEFTWVYISQQKGETDCKLEAWRSLHGVLLSLARWICQAFLTWHSNSATEEDFYR